jgi:hypothetical protein
MNKITSLLLLAIFTSGLGWAGVGGNVVTTALIPETPSARVYNYYCTWAAQNYLYGQGLEKLEWDNIKGEKQMANARGLMGEKVLTEGAEAWLKFYPSVRSDLWFLLDDGYNTKNKDGMEIDPKKFPSCVGKTPGERQKILSKLVKDAGWRGLGLWSRGYPGDDAAKEKIDWSKEAGIGYWKIDTGDWDTRYIKLRSAYPGLIIEHADHLGVYTGKGETSMKELIKSSVSERRHSLMRATDVARIYDVDQPLSQVTALLRVAGMLNDANGDKKVTAIINAEDQVSIAAGLGCSFGIFRFPISGKRPDGDPDIFTAGPRHIKNRMDEVVRAVRWHRVAPPIPANATSVVIDETGLADTWSVSQGETWNKNTGPVTQSAPARVARGLPLPSVHIQGEPPFVLACRHPQGPVTVTTLGRHSNVGGYHIPLADVKLEVGTIPPLIGVFGRYRTLTLSFSEPVAGRRIVAQDIAGKTAVDITQEVILKGNEIKIPGELINRIGLAAATPGDESDPGMALAIQ